MTISKIGLDVKDYSGVLDSDLELAEGDSQVRLEFKTIWDDDFNSGYIAGNWPTVTETGVGHVTWQNNRVELDGIIATDVNGTSSKALTFADGNYLEIEIYSSSDMNFMFGLSGNSALHFDANPGCIFNWAAGSIYVRKDGVLIDLVFDYSYVTNYTLRFVCQDGPDVGGTNSIIVQIKGGTWTDWTGIYTYATSMTTMYFQMQCYSNHTGLLYFDNFKWYGEYADDSPEVEFTEIDLESSRTIEVTNIIENPGSEAGSEKYQYKIDGGAWSGSWLTLAQLKVALDGTGSGAAVAFKVQFNSDGSQGAAIANTGDLLEIGSASGGGGEDNYTFDPIRG